MKTQRLTVLLTLGLVLMISWLIAQSSVGYAQVSSITIALSPVGKGICTSTYTITNTGSGSGLYQFIFYDNTEISSPPMGNQVGTFADTIPAGGSVTYNLASIPGLPGNFAWGRVVIQGSQSANATLVPCPSGQSTSPIQLAQIFKSYNSCNSTYTVTNNGGSNQTYNFDFYDYSAPFYASPIYSFNNVISAGGTATYNLASIASLPSGLFRMKISANTPSTVSLVPCSSEPPTQLSVFNDNTGGNVTFTVLGTGVSCTVPTDVIQSCGSFPPGTYNVEVISACGTMTTPITFTSGPVTKRVFCNTPPVDTTPPSITNIQESADPIKRQDCTNGPNTVTIRANVSDASGLSWVRLYYLPPNSSSETYTTMSLESGNTYKVTIGPFSTVGDITYYIKARDNANNEELSSISKVQVTSCKPPLVLVHGWQPPLFGQTFTCSQGIVPYNGINSTLGGELADWLDLDFEVWIAHLSSGPDGTISIEDNAQCLKQQINQVYNESNQKVIVVAHSMGGVVSRGYIESNYYQGDVETLFTLGSPHTGVLTDLLLFAVNGGSLGLVCNYHKALCDMTVVGMIAFNSQHNKPQDVDYHWIVGNAPLSSRNYLGWVTNNIIPLEDDGFVETLSGLGTFLSIRGNIDRFQTDEVHATAFGPRSYFIRNDQSHSKAFSECLQPVLMDKTKEYCGSISIQQVVFQNGSNPTKHTPFEYGTIKSGQTIKRNIAIEGNSTLFVAHWQEGTVAVTLIAPNNQIIDPAYAANNPNIVTYQADPNTAIYQFPNPIPGTWQLVLSGQGNIPSEGTPYTTFAAFDSSIALAGETDRNWYVPGATATIKALVTGAPTSATVKATISDTNGGTQTITLSPTGGSNYQANYSVPNAPGYAEVRLTATGTTSSGASFERGQILAFQISPSSASLNGSYSDTPQPSLSNPSLYDALNINIGINATVNGAFGLSADLVDTAGNFVAHSLTIKDLTKGANTVSLRFEGSEIYISGRNGPYLLTNVLLTDKRSASLVITEAQNVYTTTAYDYHSFKPESGSGPGTDGSVYLPIILK